MPFDAAARRLWGTPLVVSNAVTAGTSYSVAAAELTELKVCSDPDNLPYSNERREGFENKIAEIIARDLGLSLTHYWDWTGFPVVSLPTGVGSRSGLPTSVSLIGPPGADWDLLSWAVALQNGLGTVSP